MTVKYGKKLIRFFSSLWVLKFKGLKKALASSFYFRDKS